MKKLVAILLAAVLCFALAGCDKRVIELPEGAEFVLGTWEGIGPEAGTMEIREDGTCFYNGEEYKWGYVFHESYHTLLDLYDGRKAVARMDFHSSYTGHGWMDLLFEGTSFEDTCYFFPKLTYDALSQLLISDWYRSVTDGAPCVSISEDLTFTMDGMVYPWYFRVVSQNEGLIELGVGSYELDQGFIHFLPDYEGRGRLDVYVLGKEDAMMLYSDSQVEFVELTTENWSDYFEFRETVVLDTDEFGEIQGARLDYFFCVREEYADRIIDTDFSFEYEIDLSTMALGEYLYLVDTQETTITTIAASAGKSGTTVDSKKVETYFLDSEGLQIFWYDNSDWEMDYNAVDGTIRQNCYVAQEGTFEILRILGTIAILK